VVGKLGVNTSPLSQTTASVNGTLQATMGRFSGWTSSGNNGTGLGLEVGISSGDGYVMAYNRTTSVYEDLRLVSNASQIHLSNVSGGKIEMSGKVGIGVTPSAKLHIQGDNGDQLKLDNDGDQFTQINFANNNSAKTFITLDHTGHKFIIGAQGSYSDLDYISFRPDGTNDDLVIERGGNVGIGTTSPDSKLSVVGNNWDVIKMSDSELDATNKSAYLTIGHYTNAEESFGLISGRSTSSTNILNLGGNAAGLNTATEIGFYTASNNTTTTGTQRMTIDSSGNVGINCTPDTKFHIADLGEALLRLERTATGLGTNSGVGSIEFKSNDDSANGTGVVSKIQCKALNSYGNTFALAFSTGNGGSLTEKMVLDNDGRLHVKSSTATGANFILETTNSGGIPLLDVKGAHSAQLRYKDELDVIQGRIDFGDSGTFNFIDVPNNKSTLYLETGGNVGIGTVDPDALIHISGASNGTQTYALFSTGPANGDQNLHIQSSSSRDHMALQVKTGAGAVDDLSLNPDGGNVGIGTDDPQTTLEIFGGQYSSSYPSMLNVVDDETTFNTANNGGGISFGAKYTSSSEVRFIAGIQGVKANNTSGNFGGALRFLIRENGTSLLSEKMRVGSTGNVGIGTDSPAALIHGMSGDLFLTANSTSADSGQGIYFQSTTSGWATNSAHAAIFGKRVDASNGYLRFDTRSGGNTAERMRIDSSGNVGINCTPDTNYKLDVNGDARIGGNRTATSLLIEASDDNGAPSYTSIIKFKGYESRAQGIFFENSTYTGEEWFAGTLYNGAFNAFVIGYDEAGSQAEYDANYKFKVTTGGSVYTQNSYYAGNGNTTYPSFSFRSDPNTGMFRAGEDHLKLITGGTSRLEITSSGHATFSGTITSTDNANGSGDNIVVSTTNKDVNLYAISSKRSGTTVGGMRIDGRFHAASGSLTYPAYAFIDDANTGMFRAGSDHLQLTSGGTGRLRVSADVSVIGSTDLLVTGANRRLSFTSGTGTVRTTTAADLYLATNSTNRVQVTSAGAVKATRDGGSNLIQVARIHDGSLTGNDSATSFTITHNLETGKPIAVVIDDTSGAYVEAQIVVASNNAITVSFNDAPASGKVYRVPVTG